MHFINHSGVQGSECPSCDVITILQPFSKFETKNNYCLSKTIELPGQLSDGCFLFTRNHYLKQPQQTKQRTLSIVTVHSAKVICTKYFVKKSS